MSVFTTIYIDITLEAANDPFFEPPTPTEPSTAVIRCIHLDTCQNPYCFKHGCLNALRQQVKEVRS